jgi:hypothetical protein
MESGRQKGAADIYSVLKPITFASKVFGLAPYSVVGDTGRRKISVSAKAMLYSVGMFIIIAGALTYCQLKMEISWKNICVSSGNIQSLGTYFTLTIGYYTSLIKSKKIACQLHRLNDVIGKTYYSAWKKDLRTILTVEMFAATMLVIAGILEFSKVNFYEAWVFVFGYIAEFACIMPEYQFIAITIVLKRLFQNWNNHIVAVGETDDINNLPNYPKLINRRASNILTIPNTSRISDSLNMQSKVTRFKYLRELNVSACEVAESVNSIFSLMLLTSIARMFISFIHILYYMLMNIIVQKTSFSCTELSNEAYLILLLYYAVRLIWLVYFPSSAAKEVSQHIL